MHGPHEEDDLTETAGTVLRVCDGRRGRSAWRFCGGSDHCVLRWLLPPRLVEAKTQRMPSIRYLFVNSCKNCTEEFFFFFLS
jgi:hypothetical protein